MKRNFFILLLIALCVCSCTDGIWDSIHDLENKYSELDGRVARLEELCKEMNTNISALQTLVSVIVNNDYIVSVTPVYKENEEIGYTITFAIHTPITIYHGQNGTDGKDGQDGKDGTDGIDGQDGITPVIGVKQDTEDHAYYWTINGEWLLNDMGERIPVTSKDGKNGKDGADGQDGTDGKDGITPLLKIEDNYWYVSTDNGITWQKLGKAVGEDGKDGKDGKDGEKEDSMFSSVTEDDDFVCFTLANGIVLTVSKYKDDTVKIDGAIIAEFSVSDTKKVYFSMGELQFSEEGSHVCADGTTKSGTWRFAPDQWSSTVEDGWTNTFTWGSSGVSISIPDPTSTIIDMAGQYRYLDWGAYNAISNGGNIPDTWRTLSNAEWSYLFNRAGGAMWVAAKVYTDISNYIYCIVIFPDNYAPFSINHNQPISYSDDRDRYIAISGSTMEDWRKHGAVALRFDLIGDSRQEIVWLNCSYQEIVYKIYSNGAEVMSSYSVLQKTSSYFSCKERVRLVKDTPNK